ncbi:MAG: hypothetical protein K9K65_17235 [Desulfarculaceae bacterium]|nr:hypothetical protein [Desulfarculaceae bacterium]MCF8048058.1 hypothetical protein [Desulfarculaceae bacterium]MCF8099587.1 hypothetical protein [Desulfarculaceae bacterium]MCF8122913.1 hypothetical protein [Desulfarculaceae bacterium]
MKAMQMVYGLIGSAVFVGIYLLASNLERFWVAFPLFVISVLAIAVAGDRIKKLDAKA